VRASSLSVRHRAASRGRDKIWALQSYLAAEAEKQDIPLIVNSGIDEALHELLMRISDTIIQGFAPGAR
jgi:2-phosphoglycerate kinase